MLQSWPELLRRADLAEFTATLLPDAKCREVNTDHRTGKQTSCKTVPLPGLDLCWHHARQLEPDPANHRVVSEHLMQRGLARAEEARALLYEAAPQAAARLAQEAIDGPEHEPTTIRAITSLLDRAGVPATSKAEVSSTSKSTVINVDVNSVLKTLLDRLEQQAKQQGKYNASEIIEAEIVEEPAPEAGTG